MLQNWQDEPKRVRWRAKQVLDYAYLLELAGNWRRDGRKAEFYIQMEDDVNCAWHYLTEIAWWLHHFFYQRTDWYLLSYYTAEGFDDHEAYSALRFYGFIGQLSRIGDLPSLCQFYRDNFDVAPVDWLLRDFVLAQQRLTGRFQLYVHYPPLFQHVGTVSSLDGKN